jgi:hypothetical protein
MTEEVEEELTAAQIREAEEQHAYHHARFQVDRATPDNPECVFDYELVATLLRIIDRLERQALVSSCMRLLERRPGNDANALGTADPYGLGG